MRIAFVVQRCGPKIFGGAESLALDVARHLADIHDVEILTTCAHDASTWHNYYPAGAQNDGKLVIRRFSVDHPRDPKFVQIASELDYNRDSVEKGREFLDALGPVCGGLAKYISEHRDTYDLFVFVGYLYWHTYNCIGHVGNKSILLPTAHDEPWIHYSVFRNVFDTASGFAFLTESEKQFVDKTFGISSRPFEIVGHGMDIDTTPRTTRLDVPSRYILYVGRINHAKGCRMLSDYFNRYAAINNPDLGLVMVGDYEQNISDCRATICKNIPDSDKLALLQNCEIFAMPSFYESLNMACLEAWLFGKPVLANSRSEVLYSHCKNSNGGLYFDDYEQFSETLTYLLDNPQVRYTMGQNGKNYVQQNYNWTDTLKKYQGLFARLVR